MKLLLEYNFYGTVRRFGAIRPTALGFGLLRIEGLMQYHSPCHMTCHTVPRETEKRSYFGLHACSLHNVINFFF